MIAGLYCFTEGRGSPVAKKKSFYTEPELPFPPTEPLDENLAEAVRASLSRTIRISRKSREQLSEGLSRRLGITISHHVLNSFTAESRPGHKFPFEYVLAWIRETRDDSLLRLLCTALGRATPEPGSGDLVEFARARIKADLAGQEAEGLKARLIRKGAG